MSLPVAVVQLAADADAAGNARRSAEAVRDAARTGADLVVLPEYAAGWARRLSPDLAQPMDGMFVTALREAAREAGVWVVAGMMEPVAGDSGRSRNVALLIGPDGEVAGRYVKVHLFDAYGVQESEVLEAGPADADNVLTFDVDGLRVGVATCYDLRFPETFRMLTDAGAQVLVVIAAWADGPGKAEQLDVLARARALENTAYLLLASQPGGGRVGRSAIIEPLGRVVNGAPSSDKMILAADLDPDVLARAREAVPSLTHRKFRVLPGAPA